MARELRATITAGAPVYIDALDEAAPWEPAVFRVLEYYLRAAGPPWFRGAGHYGRPHGVSRWRRCCNIVARIRAA
jgi:hypothetical protein